MQEKHYLLAMPVFAMVVGAICHSGTPTQGPEPASSSIATCDSLRATANDPLGKDWVMTMLVRRAEEQIWHSRDADSSLSTGSSTTLAGGDTVTATAWVIPHGVLGDSIAVALAWAEHLIDANAAGIVFDGRFCFGGVRSLGILDLGNTSSISQPVERAKLDSIFDAPRLQWNAALKELGAREILRDDRGALKLTDLFLSFAIGEIPLDLPRSSGGPLVTLKQLPGLTLQAVLLSGLTTEERDQVWRSTGTLDVRGRHQFSVEMDRYGIVRRWSMISQ